MAVIAPGLIAPPSNGTLINGVAHFVTTSKPTVRVDGSALVTGDRWYKSDDGTDWFWNGTYWLSATERIIAAVPANNLSVTTNLGLVESKAPVMTSESMSANQMNIFTTRCLLHSRGMPTNNESNYWTCSISAQNGFGTSPDIFPAIPTVDTIGATPQGGYGLRKVTAINQLQTSIPYNVTAIITKVGSPSNLVAHFIFLYRTVYT